MNYKKFTKITSGTLLLSATSALASQTQGGVAGASGLAQNEASKAFLQNGAYGSESAWRILKILGVSVVAVILVVGISAYCLKKSHENKLSQIDALIEEIQNLKPESFFKGEALFNDANERNKKLVDSLNAKTSSFSNKKLDGLFGELKVSARDVLTKEVNKSGYRDDIEKRQSFLKQAKEAYSGIKEAYEISSEFLVRPNSYYFFNTKNREEWESTAKEKAKEVRSLLKKWEALEFYDIFYADKENKKNLEDCIKDFVLDLRGNILYDRESLNKLDERLRTLDGRITSVAEKLQEIEGPLNAAMEKFNEKKREIVDALTNIKKEKEKKGIFGSLWSSNQPVLNNEAEA